MQVNPFESQFLLRYEPLVQGVLKCVPFQQKQDALIATGSLVQGFGSNRSDLDVYVLMPEKLTRDTEGMESIGQFESIPREVMVEPTTQVALDVFYYPWNVVRDIGIAISEAASGESGINLGRFSEQVLTFCHRLLVGVALHLPEQAEEFKSLIDREAFKICLCRLRVRAFDNQVEDAVGAMETGDMITAMVNARRAYQTAMDVYLIDRGETDTNFDKWRWVKLQRTCGADTLEARRFLELDWPQLDVSDTKQTRTYIQRCLDLGKQIVMPVAMSVG
jgi:hypothetical protein